MVHEASNQVDAHSVEFHPGFVLRRLGPRLVEIKHQTTPREPERVALFQEIQEGPGFRSRGRLHQAIAQPALQIELEQNAQLARLEQPVRAVGGDTPRVEVHLNHALALVELLDHLLLQMVVAAQAELLGVALHLDQVAGDRPVGEIEIEQREVGPAHGHLVADGLRLGPGGMEQVEVRIERHDDLVAQRALMGQEHPRQRQSEGLGPRRRRRDELERQPPRERAQLIEDGHGLRLFRFETVLAQHGSENRLQLAERPRADDEAVSVLGRCRRRVVDEVVGAVAAAAVVEELDAHVPVHGEHPVTRLVHFADERAAVAI